MNHRKLLLGIILIGVIIVFGLVKTVLASPPVIFSTITKSNLKGSPDNKCWFQNKSDVIHSEHELNASHSQSDVEVRKAMNYFKKEPFQLNQSYNIPSPPSTYYEGKIWTENLMGEVIENGDAENSNLTKWSQDYNTADSTEIQRFNSTNALGYHLPPQGDDYFYFLNATSETTQWTVDYVLNQRIPSTSLLISFQFANRYAPWTSQLAIYSLNLVFEFEEFDIIFGLFTNNQNVNYFNQTDKNIYFELNNPWGDHWSKKTANITTALLEQGFYTPENLPWFFHLKRVLIECWGEPPYKFHLLLDNLSLQSPVLPPPEFLVNGIRFQIVNHQNEIEIEGFVKEDLQVQPILTGNFSGFSSVVGDLIFDIWFQEVLDPGGTFAYENSTCINWEVVFYLTKTEGDLHPKVLFIKIPQTWALTSLKNSDNTELLTKCNVTYPINDPSHIVVEIYDELIPGKWNLTADAPNYILPLQVSPKEVEQNSSVQINLALRTFLENPVTIVFEKDGNNHQTNNDPSSEIIISSDGTLSVNFLIGDSFQKENYAIEGQIMDGTLLVNFSVGDSFPKGNYTIKAHISDGFCGGLQHGGFTVTTDPASLWIEVFHREIPRDQLLRVRLQMVNSLTKRPLDAKFYYTWDDVTDFVCFNSTYVWDNATDFERPRLSEDNVVGQTFQLPVSELSIGNHILILEGRSPGYSTRQESVPITILPAIRSDEFDNDKTRFNNTVTNLFQPFPDSTNDVPDDYAKQTPNSSSENDFVWQVISIVGVLVLSTLVLILRQRRTKLVTLFDDLQKSG